MPGHFKPAVTRLTDISTHHVDVLRLDLIHPVTGGNKYYKLKYNIAEAIERGYDTICTFGGAYSNHIAATAQACKEAGLNSIGVIRGEDRGNSPTVRFARENGMNLVFIDRELYSRRNEKTFIESLRNEYGEFYLVPEGGSNAAGVKGASEIVGENGDYDYILCACGTATTYAGILSSGYRSALVIGISVLKGANELPAAVRLITGLEVEGDGELEHKEIKAHCILSAYSFSGYARFSKGLVEFKRTFENLTGIAIDHVYTVKLFYAVYDLCRLEKLRPGSRVLVVHTGGVQGNRGFEMRYQRKLIL